MPRPATVQDNVRLAVAEYVAGRIEVNDLERALEHIYGGGMGCVEFPYLPMFEAFETELVWR